jgi:hypothetical protein
MLGSYFSSSLQNVKNPPSGFDGGFLNPWDLDYLSLFIHPSARTPHISVAIQQQQQQGRAFRIWVELCILKGTLPEYLGIVKSLLRLFKISQSSRWKFMGFGLHLLQALPAVRFTLWVQVTLQPLLVNG